MPDASWGYTAEQGLKGVLGSEDIDKIRRHEGAMSPKEMRKYIEEAPDELNVSYSDEARRFAKAILVDADQSIESFLADSRGFTDKVYTKQEELGNRYDLTGFMFGWAFNAVRYVLGEKPNENPAIVTIGRSE